MARLITAFTHSFGFLLLDAIVETKRRRPPPLNANNATTCTAAAAEETTMAGPDSKQSPSPSAGSSGSGSGSSTMMVNLAEDAVARSVSILTDSEPSLHEACSRQLQQPDPQQQDQLLKTLIESDVAMNALMVELDAEEAMGALSVLSVVMVRLRPANQKTTLSGTATATNSSSLLQDLAAKIVSTGTDTDRKISFVSILFNVASDNASKSALLATLFDVASSASSTASSSSTSSSPAYLHPEGSLGRIIYPTAAATASSALSMVTALGDETAQPLLTQMMHQMKWTTQQRCHVLDAVCRALARAIPHDETEQVLCRQRFLLQYIREDTTQTVIAEQVAIGAIRDPISLFRLQRNLLPTVQSALAATKPQLYELLKIVQHGTLADYQAHVKRYGAQTIAALGIDVVQCEVHMRLLTVCSLANNYEADIPYQEIATAAQQDVSQVESTVIQAIRTGLLQAKMDQLNQTVMVERSVVRQFDLDQWKKLHARLTTWKANVGGILDTLKQQQQQQHQVMAAASSAAGQ
jgi:translation initiation factor 3 subunit M